MPGLALATVPSLLWVLAVDPVSPRAHCSSAAPASRWCWSAPGSAGARRSSSARSSAGCVVLREVAPYAEATPRWVLIGLAGTVLTVVGVTWEQRVLELRRATAYLGRLR